MASAPLGTIPQILAAGQQDKPALIFPDTTRTFAELGAGADRWAGLLQSRGVGKGDFVGVLLPTCPEFVELVFAVAGLGAVFVPINPRYRARELRHIIVDAGLVTLITTDEVVEHVDFVERIAEALPSAARNEAGRFACDDAPDLRFIAVIGGDGRYGTTPVNELSLGSPVSGHVAPDDLAMILYTSGTSAAPKGCLLTHAIICRSVSNYVGHYGITASDSFWVPLPVYHVAGLIPLLAIFSAGGAFLTLRRFDAGDALTLIAQWRPTIGLPSYVTIVQDLMDHPDFAGADFDCFRWMNTSPSVQPKELREAWARAMPHVAQVGTYGMTEGVGPVTGHCLTDSPETCANGLGRPMQGWEVRIVNSDSGLDVAEGEVGEIWIRGAALAAGYHRHPEPIADAEGWFHTGDLGAMDDGQTLFRGRLKDMMKVGGENVAAPEIEAVLDLHPAVRLSQVVGVPDPRYVEVPVAFVQLVDGERITGDQLIEHCRGKLASFKLPRDIVFVDDWPMSTTKIQKFRLRDLYAERADAAA